MNKSFKLGLFLSFALSFSIALPAFRGTRIMRAVVKKNLPRVEEVVKIIEGIRKLQKLPVHDTASQAKWATLLSTVQKKATNITECPKMLKLAKKLDGIAYPTFDAQEKLKKWETACFECALKITHGIEDKK